MWGEPMGSMTSSRPHGPHTHTGGLADGDAEVVSLALAALWGHDVLLCHLLVFLYLLHAAPPHPKKKELLLQGIA